MRRTRQLIAGILLGLGLVAIAATTYGPGMGRFWGDTTLTTLLPGAVYYNTASNTLWFGDSTSNPVMVGSAAWSNNVTASVTNGLATTGMVYAADAGLVATNETRNISVSNLTVNGDVTLANTVWDDLRVPLFTRTAGGNFPTYSVFTNGVYAYKFAAGKEIFWEAQMPHSYKHGSQIHFHVHTASAGTSTNAVIWGVEFTAATIGSNYTATVNYAVTNAAPGVAYRHGTTEIVEWTPPAGFLGSSIVIGRVYRGSDSNPDDYYLLAIDLHHEKDKLGSAEELPAP